MRTAVDFSHQTPNKLVIKELLKMILTHELQVDYLANVIGMARANGKVFPEEKAAVESIQMVIGAGASELTQAYSIAKNADFAPKVIGLWSNQVKNLEHIIYLSLLDGKIDNDEKRYILQIAKKIKISQDQLNFIIHDVKQSSSGLPKNITHCKQCQSMLNNAVKFCTECGTSVSGDPQNRPATAASVTPAYDIPTKGIAIEFAESSEAGVSLAMNAMAFAAVQETCEKDGQLWHLVAWSSSQMTEALPLIEAVKSLSSKKAHVDGEAREWSSVFAFSRCANGRKSAFRGEEYCFGIDDMKLNLWGCRSIHMEWNDWADWLSYGNFKESDAPSRHIFVFDKKRIRHELETNLYGCQLCPHLQHNLIEAVLEELPNEVTANYEGDWIYKKDYRETPGAILIKEPIHLGRYSTSKAYYSSSVTPTIHVGIKILKKAFAKCGLPAEHLSSLDQYKE